MPPPPAGMEKEGGGAERGSTPLVSFRAVTRVPSLVVEHRTRLTEFALCPLDIYVCAWIAQEARRLLYLRPHSTQL
ncbi:hypothetical protein, conserved [Leishmania donovani]|uniref:Uncharacterized protein n=1 Tax=Leishmania donovani TaxID=5661 RepID=E9B874_LEIDO|nr:hypothetical protein, conserved [Leishmania donovani]CBZ31447.1 hypothetical protein, conserved [Leishmania donovani]